MNYFFHVERQASQKRGKNLETPLFDYDDDYLARIDEAYERERPPGRRAALLGGRDRG